MDLATTRRSLHGVAELLLAGPQFRTCGTIRLRVTPGGFGQVNGPLRVEGTELVWAETATGRAPLAGTYRELAARAGTEPGAPEGVYPDVTGISPADEIVVDGEAVALLTAWFAAGEQALRAFAPDLEPVLWPEHLDLAITKDEVNYGVSPGDGGHETPYAYVGPWTPREGPFWNAPFGAIHEDRDTLLPFFRDGAAQAS
ncbi:hypothetical protein GCM10009836_59270 [Pseudonocardia ailaonensis]|uniref:Uncharacterized protein n=1 Tax=Pseudonocardia ailaonensis TaxID=367279 RepID=A0ABN2NIH2_9PSEU